MESNEAKSESPIETRVYTDGGLWWYHDETDEIQGPFNTKEEAQRDLDKLSKWLNQPPRPKVGDTVVMIGGVNGTIDALLGPDHNDRFMVWLADGRASTIEWHDCGSDDPFKSGWFEYTSPKR